MQGLFEGGPNMRKYGICLSRVANHFAKTLLRRGYLVSQRLAASSVFLIKRLCCLLLGYQIALTLLLFELEKMKIISVINSFIRETLLQQVDSIPWSGSSVVLLLYTHGLHDHMSKNVYIHATHTLHSVLQNQVTIIQSRTTCKPFANWQNL